MVDHHHMVRELSVLNLQLDAAGVGTIQRRHITQAKAVIGCHRQRGKHRFHKLVLDSQMCGILHQNLCAIRIGAMVGTAAAELNMDELRRFRQKFPVLKDADRFEWADSHLAL